MTICISSGHGRFVRGARGPSPWGVDEVDEARRIVNRVAELLRGAGVTTHVFHDDSSRTVTANLNAIVSFHNSRTRTLDVSCHLNAFQVTSGPRGCEVLHRTQPTLAANVSRAIASAGGFINRGAKVRSNLSFLNRVSRPGLLLEPFFVDSQEDVRLFRQNFEAVCRAIASSISGVSIGGGGGSGGGGTSPPSTSRPMIRQGSRGEAVREAQRLLNRHGASPRLNEDGIFGPLTATATRSFQTRRGLAADAIIGPLTWAALLS